ncbi:MAG: hypothetical protein C0490_11785 [Marivirga sp.]|nr:hypothetical protein [Marivirga sp.]
MCNPNYLADAIDTVLAMDLPDHLISIAICDQAKLNAGFDCDSNLHQDCSDEIFGFNPLSKKLFTTY